MGSVGGSVGDVAESTGGRVAKSAGGDMGDMGGLASDSETNMGDA